jgi:glycosyltransferase involved in cell wall biosynthesis
MKADLVIWAKNGASMLPLVLKRADEVLPNEVIAKKIFVDDHSTDESREIAKDFGWRVYNNKNGGIACGVNTALKRVESKYFISLEQDLVLAKNWFEKIPKHLEKPNVVSAMGIRYPDDPILRKMHEFSLDKSDFTMGSMDNSMWKTRIVKFFVVIPEYLKYGAVDSYMGLRLRGFESVVDPSVVSVHLRKGGLKGEIKRYYFMGLYAPRMKGNSIDETELKRAFKIAVFSPFRELEVAVKKRCPQITCYYPLIRFSFLRGALRRGGGSEVIK